jgi:uncharacterized RDD family membrane protein YckC
MNKYYGGFWARTAALMIDSMLMLILGGLIKIAFGLSFLGNSKDTSYKSLAATLMTLLAVGLYYTIYQGLFSGTLGKRALGLKLLDAQTLEQISIGQALGRYSMQFVSGICLGLGYFNVGVNERKQGWHDKVAKTVVVKESMLKKLRENEGILPKTRIIPKVVMKKAA